MSDPDLKKCSACRKPLPPQAYERSADSVCAPCLSIHKKLMGALRSAKQEERDLGLMAPCESRRLAQAATGPDVKFCSVCQTTKEAKAFSRDASKYDGLCYRCKSCDKPRQVAAYKKRNTEDPDYYRAHSRSYQRVRRQGIPLRECQQRFGLSFNDVEAGVRHGEIVRRCVKGQWLYLPNEMIQGS